MIPLPTGSTPPDYTGAEDSSLLEEGVLTNGTHSVQNRLSKSQDARIMYRPLRKLGREMTKLQLHTRSKHRNLRVHKHLHYFD
jgi:hypothetical protein